MGAVFKYLQTHGALRAVAVAAVYRSPHSGYTRLSAEGLE